MILESSTVEKLSIEVTTDADPTASVIEFAAMDASATGEPSVWVSGSWISGSWTGAKARALTPTLGGVGSGLPLTEGGSYRLWVKITSATEVVVKRLITIAVN